MIYELNTAIDFPPAANALRSPNGLLAYGGDLSPERLLAAYSRGIFPWYSQGEPILWWSPDPRMVLIPDAIHISRSLAKLLRKNTYAVQADSVFDAVVTACAQAKRPDQTGTWITAELATAYHELHRLGHAHSVEVWREGNLVGGVYGISIGQAFFAESMFHHETDCSKIALVFLCKVLVEKNFGIIDCQMETTHLRTLGASPIPRNDFCSAIATLTTCPNTWPDSKPLQLT